MPRPPQLKDAIEEIMKTRQYMHFNEWVTNFSLNLPFIWKEKSAKALVPKEREEGNGSAIVIGRGPSINKYEHLKLLAESDYEGSIICCDGKLADALRAGVTPDKFPHYYVITIDPYPTIKKHYDHDIIKSYGSDIKGMFTVITNFDVVAKARESSIQIHWLHSLLDYNEGTKSFNNISAIMTRAKDSNHRLPAIQTGGNVGTSAWFAAWQILKCSTVALIGINHGWTEEDSWETITHHGIDGDVVKGIDRNSKTFEKLYKKIYNPDFDCHCILDPLFQFYSEALKEFIERSPEWLTTINATEGGSIFGERIKSMRFGNFLGA